jgi:hypothetical protein
MTFLLRDPAFTRIQRREISMKSETQASSRSQPQQARDVMQITDVEASVQLKVPNPTPIADALQVLPGAGSVMVRLTTDEGISGEGAASFGRIAGGPDALAALIEHELKPLVIGQDPVMVRHLHREMLRETEYHGSAGLATFLASPPSTRRSGIVWGELAECLAGNSGVACTSASGRMRWWAG